MGMPAAEAQLEEDEEGIHAIRGLLLGLRSAWVLEEIQS